MTTLILVTLEIGLVAVTLPVTAELAVLTLASLLPKGKRRGPASPNGLALTVIVPAHNEELLIGRAIESLRASSSGVRILAVAHNCSDQTAERAAEAGAEVLIYNDQNARGKGFALRYGFERAFAQGADAALVVDADSFVSKNLIGQVCEALSGGAQAVQCRYEMSATGDSAKTRLTALALRGFNLIRPRGRHRLGLSCSILGNGFAIRGTVSSQIPYRALSLVEDLEYHIHLVVAGKRVEFLEEAQVFSELPASKTGEATQRSRWEGGRFHAARQWLAPLTGRILRGQLRLLEPFLDLAGLPLAYAVSLLLAALLLPVPWLRVYALAGLAVAGAHVLAAAYAGNSFWRDLRGLCTAPAYILWKFRLVPRLLRESSANAPWVRTERAPAPPQI